MVPQSNNPFQAGILGIQTTNWNHQLTTSWKEYFKKKKNTEDWSAR